MSLFHECGNLFQGLIKRKKIPVVLFSFSIVCVDGEMVYQSTFLKLLLFVSDSSLTHTEIFGIFFCGLNY